MPIARINVLQLSLIVVAAILSVFNGALSLLTTLVFSDHESVSLWIAIILPALLWLPALTCIRFPLAGFLVFVILLSSSVFLGVNPVHYHTVGLTPWMSRLEDLRFAVLGAGLLFANLILSNKGRKSQKYR